MWLFNNCVFSAVYCLNGNKTYDKNLCTETFHFTSRRKSGAWSLKRRGSVWSIYSTHSSSYICSFWNDLMFCFVFVFLIIYNCKIILTSEAQMLRTDVVKTTLCRDANSDRVPAQSLFRRKHSQLFRSLKQPDMKPHLVTFNLCVWNKMAHNFKSCLSFWGCFF